MQEIWKEVPGYNGAYQFSNLNRCRSTKRKEMVYLKVVFSQKRKYPYYKFYQNGCKYTMFISVLKKELFSEN